MLGLNRARLATGAGNGAACTAPLPVLAPDKVCYSAHLQGGHDPVRLRGALVRPHAMPSVCSAALSYREDAHG